MLFACAQCQTPITKALEFTNEPPPPAPDGGSVGYPLAGFFAVADPGGWQPELYPNMSAYFVFNLSDVLNTTRDVEHTVGCCGSDGMNGINVLCVNGHGVGIEFSDCWQPYHYLHAPPDRVVKVE